MTTRPLNEPDWRAIAAALAWSLTDGRGHTQSEEKALAQYDAAVVREQQRVTDPLIDRDALDEVLDGHLMYRGKERVAAADAVLAYLRWALTPEALGWAEDRGWAETQDFPFTTTGTDLHRRIFGEDK